MNHSTNRPTPAGGRLPRRTVCATALSGLLAVVVGACSAPGTDPGTTASANGTGPIRIAIADAQSGQLSSVGNWELKGAKLAIDQRNAAGGVDGRQIEYTVFDTQGDPTTGTSIARKITSEGYVAMIGTAESAVTQAMNPILLQAKIPAITSGQSPAISALGSPFQFLNGPTSVTYDETLAEYLVGTEGLHTFAMISNNGGYGTGEHNAFLDALSKRGITPTDDAVVTADQKDFSSVLSTIRDHAPDVLFIGAEEVEAGLIAKQAHELGLTTTLAGAAPLTTTVYAQTAGQAAVEGTVVSSPYLTNDTNDTSKAFADAYQKAYGEVAELHGAKAFDGTNIFLDALDADGGKGGQALADAIRSTPYDGLLGTFDFDDTGVGIHETRIGKIVNGQLTSVQ